MSGKLRLWGVVLAAGDSTRMGTDKALLPWPPESSATGTLLSAAIQAMAPWTEAVIVVAGRNAERLAPIAVARGAKLVENPTPERGQFSSLQTGLRALRAGGGDAAMIAPVDCPPLAAASLERLCAAFGGALRRGQWAVAPERGGRHGHPLLAGRELIEAFLAAPTTANAREINQTHAGRIEYVTVDDAALGAELNTPHDYEALASSFNSESAPSPAARPESQRTERGRSTKRGGGWRH